MLSVPEQREREREREGERSEDAPRPAKAKASKKQLVAWNVSSSALPSSSSSSVVLLPDLVSTACFCWRATQREREREREGRPSFVRHGPVSWKGCEGHRSRDHFGSATSLRRVEQEQPFLFLFLLPCGRSLDVDVVLWSCLQRVQSTRRHRATAGPEGGR